MRKKILPLLVLTALTSCDPLKEDTASQPTGTTDSADTDTDTDTDTDDSGEGDPDADGDGYPASEDCNDDNADIHPGADELCNGADDNCNDEIDEGATDPATWYLDSDDDGYGTDSDTVESCEAPSGYVDNDDDCDDSLDTIHPDAEEICNGSDDNCNDIIDDEPVDGADYFEDSDGDGFGNPDVVMSGCAAEGLAENDFDCDDADSTEPHYVDASATGRGTGTLADPWPFIQDGIEASSACVLVAPGTYAETVNFGGANLLVSSVEGARTTIIDGTGLDGSAVTFNSRETSEAVLDGFTITGGTGSIEKTEEARDCGSGAVCTDYFTVYCGGGVFVDEAEPTLRNLVVWENELPEASSTPMDDDTYYIYSYGAGLCAMSTNLSLDTIDFTGNVADQGGGIFVSADALVSMVHTRFYENTAATEAGGVLVDAGAVVMENTIITSNKSGSSTGGVLMMGGAFTATNITMSGNDGSELTFTDSSSGVLINSIIANATSMYGVASDGTSRLALEHNNVYGNGSDNYYGVTDPTGTDGNISADPLFVSWSGNLVYDDDLSLDAGSPCIDAGDPSSTYDDVDGTTNDMGATGGPLGGW